MPITGSSAGCWILGRLLDLALNEAEGEVLGCHRQKASSRGVRRSVVC